MLLSLEDVRKSHWRGRHEVRVLDGISLEVDHGEFVAICGAPREGKTTLLRVASGLEAPDQGTVYFKGRDLAPAPSRWRWLRWLHPHDEGLHRDMGWVRRAGPSNKSSMSMLHYVSMSLFNQCHHGEARRRASNLLKKIGIDDLARSTWRELSDSERVLMTIAHAIIRAPELLLVDDVTRDLETDVEDREMVLRLLRSTVEQTGTAVLMTVGTVEAALRAHRILTLTDRRLVKADVQGGEVVPLRTDTA